MNDWVERKPIRPSMRKPGQLAFEDWPLPTEPLERHDPLNDMSFWQGGLCAACGVDIKRKSHLDHDHRTGKVRGYLCPSCNQAEGSSMGDAVPWGQMWTRWREGANPAAVLGVDEIYISEWTGRPVIDRESSPDEMRAAMDLLADALGLDDILKTLLTRTNLHETPHDPTPTS